MHVMHCQKGGRERKKEKTRITRQRVHRVVERMHLRLSSHAPSFSVASLCHAHGLSIAFPLIAIATARNINRS